MFNTVVQQFFKKWQEMLYYFVVNSLLFPTAKEFSKSINRWWNYCRSLWWISLQLSFISVMELILVLVHAQGVLW